MNLRDRLRTHTGTSHVNESEAAAEIERLQALCNQRGKAVGESRRECRRLEAELAKVRADYQTYVDGNDHAMGGEVERLQAIVDKLPKTADGVQVVPGMVLYAVNGLGNPTYSEFHVPSGFLLYDCWFSTKEAAEAAKEAQ